MIWGIPNGLNVLSNIPFFIAGIYGIYVLLYGNKNAFIHPTEKATYWVLFCSMCFIAAGSAYYHLWPDTDTLFWDRLPMTVGFMAMVNILFTEKVDRHFGPKTLLPFIVLGITSVLWWSFTETRSDMTGDLRFYIVVQMAPVLLTPLIVVLYPNTYTHTNYMYSATGLYILAKFTELYDKQIYTLTREIISGHTLKHIIAAWGLMLLSIMLQKRKIITETKDV